MAFAWDGPEKGRKAMIERFSKEEFETALTEMSKTGEKLWQYINFTYGEHCYAITVMDKGRKTNKRVSIRSSVNISGVAASAGKDSIRVWAEYEYHGIWRPLAKVQQHHVKRTVNWRENLREWIRATYRAALDDTLKRRHDIASAVGINNANAEKKDGLKFVKCPKCDRAMRLKTPRPGQTWKAFYGCPGYPKCKHAMTIKVHDAELKELNGQSESAPAMPDKPFIPSHYQEAFRDFIINGTGNCVLIAGPGTGKSTTALWALGFIPRNLKTAYVAFNKKIVEEFAERAPHWVQMSTLNSLGNGNIKRAFNHAKFDQYKVRNIVQDLIGKLSLSYDEGKIIETNMGAINRVVDLLKANLLDPSPENIEMVCDKYGVELNGDADVLMEYIIKAFIKSVETIPQAYDYSDQIYAGATGMVPATKFDVLICDEAQDMTVAQIHMAINSLTETGRFFAVGDSLQSIYGFRGADTQSIQNIIKLTDATVLPLMLSYRLPKIHTGKVNERFGTELESPDWAVDGIWRDDMSVADMIPMWAEGDVVLCRCNAPLVPHAFALIRRGVKAVILGRDIGVNLVALVKKIRDKTNASTLTQFIFELERYKIKQVAKLTAQNKSSRAQILEDKCNTISAIAEEGCDSLAELKASIKAIFTDNKSGVVFSSIHKAKGGEWNRVFIIKAKIMPHPKAESAWHLEQEEHIEFVAKTRSKRELYISYE